MAESSGVDNDDDVVFIAAKTGSGAASLTSTSTPSSSPIYYRNFSLAEHSYCASLGSPGGNHQEEGGGGGVHSISDVGVGGGTGDLGIQSSEEFYLEDVNFDGSNFTIPLNEEGVGGGGEAMELGGSRESLNVVEITSTSSAADAGGRKTGQQDNSKKVKDRGGADGGASGGNEIEVLNTKKKSGILGKYSRPRKRNYIENAKERGKHFEATLKRLALQLHRTISRTGCEGELSAVYEGKIFNCGPNPPSKSDHAAGSTLSGSNSVVGMPTVTIPPLEGAAAATSTVEVDDHRYAAPLLTQNVESPAVWDHQYAHSENENTKTSSQDGNIDCDQEIEDCDCDPNKSKVVKFDYVKGETARKQLLCRFAKTLFGQKLKLEQRTGAKIYLLLTYGRCIINDKNYPDCAKLINALKKPNPQDGVKPLVPCLAKSIPVTFIIPGIGPVQIPSPNNTMQLPIANNAATGQLYQVFQPSSALNNIFYPICPDSNNVILQTQTNQSTSLSNQGRSQTQQDSNWDEASVGNLQLDVSNFESDSNLTYSATFDTILNQEASSSQQQTVTTSSSVGGGGAGVETKSSATNTEPICSICQSSDLPAQARSEKLFWIRCTDPFCYDMVHSLCLGFRLTDAAQLRQLPSFYCTVHR